MIDMLGVACPSTAMIVWIRAPPSASWVPMVCRNRCAVIVALPAESTKPAAVQASARAMSKSSDLDSSFPRTTKIGWTSLPALGS
jgi:hypothetical protein